MYEIKQGDCLELMKSIPDASIDLICTDPPWLTTDLEFDKVDIDFNIIAKEFKRILKPNGWCFVFIPVELIFPFLQNGFRRKFQYVWVKSIPAMQTHNTIKPMAIHEMCFAFIHSELKRATDLTFNKTDIRQEGKAYTKLNRVRKLSEYEASSRLKKNNDWMCNNEDGRFPVDVLFGESKSTMKFSERTDHPTQKPISIIDTIVRGYSNIGDTILDPFLGSGTTAISSIRNNRNFIGYELNSDYFKIAEKRILEEIEKTSLFNSLGGLLLQESSQVCV